jgi:predicted XRE-type DNA-binding protein
VFKEIHDKELVQNEIKASREINKYKLSNLQNSQQQNFELASLNFNMLSNLIAELRIISRSLPNPK